MLRRKRPRKQRKTSNAKLGREADRLWSLIVRSRGACEECGSMDRLQGAHGFSRRYRGTRWLTLNGFALCAGCHVRYTYDPLAWDTWIRLAWGPNVYDNLRTMAQTVSKPDFAEILPRLKAEWERCQQTR